MKNPWTLALVLGERASLFYFHSRGIEICYDFGRQRYQMLFLFFFFISSRTEQVITKTIHTNAFRIIQRNTLA